MAAEEGGDKRHVFGPRAIGALVGPLTRPAFRGRSAAAAQLLADWPLVVGPALAAVTQPRRLSGTALTLACSGPIAMELQHMASEVMDRVNAHLGRVAVTRLRFVQEVLPAARDGVAAMPLPEANPAPIAGFRPGPLHDALARLGQAVARAKR